MTRRNQARKPKADTIALLLTAIARIVSALARLIRSLKGW